MSTVATIGLVQNKEKYVYAMGVGLEARKDWQVPRLNTASVKGQECRFFSVDTIVQSQQQSRNLKDLVNLSGTVVHS